MMNPEEKAREKIDQKIREAGWTLFDMSNFNIKASLGVAIREFPLKNGYSDYLLFLNGLAVGVIEAKPVGTPLIGVSEQTRKYIHGIPDDIPHLQGPLPFAYESTGVETYFRDERDPFSRSRRVFFFHKPETLNEWLSYDETLRAKLKKLPPLVKTGLRECQVEAVENLEESFSNAKPRALIQMATGAGKTVAAVSFVYRLIKFANAKRVLFLVDRSNLGKQTKTEFEQYVTPDDGRKFKELYNIQHLTSNTFDPVSRVCISTIQRIYSMLKGEEEYDPELEELSHYEVAHGEEKPREVEYNPRIPIETFDFIITDECHRSIYNLWRQVLEYFDAFIIGLTATPSKQTLGFFNQNLIMEYSHDRAVADGVNVGYEVYRIKTAISEKGSHVDSGYYIDKRDKLTRKVRWEQLDEDLDYAAHQLDRDVVAKDQIRTIIRTFKDKLFTDIFPGRKEVPKTLVFAKDDSHADDIVEIIREEFGKGNEFCKKITYKTTGEKTEDLIASFRNSFNPRIAVSVDMISTGTDIKPLECLLFIRDVRSRVYFEQMKGRGTRTISSTDLKSVTPDIDHKTHYIIVDAIGVCENDKTESRPMERKKSFPFDKLLQSVALGNREKDIISSLAGRLARLDRTFSEKDRNEIETITGGQSIKQIINGLLDVLDPDKQVQKAKEIYDTEKPTHDQIKKATEKLANTACHPFNDPKLRNTLIEIKKRNEQIIDTISKDQVLYAGSTDLSKEKAQNTINNFKKFIEKNKNELTALQIIYSRSYGQRNLTYQSIKELAEALSKSRHHLTTEQIWRAYEQLDRAKVRGAGPHKLLTDIISLLRFALGMSDILEPFSETVDARFDRWLEEQEKTGKNFPREQLEWLIMIKDHIASSLSIEMEHFEYEPFYEKGGPIKAFQVFGDDLSDIMGELNEELVA